GGGWGMAAVTGLPTRAVSTLARRVTTPTEPLWVANINSATETVLGGTVAALTAAENAARHDGAAAFGTLNVAVASHGPVQEAASEAVRAELSTVPLRTPVYRYITNVGGRSVDSAEAVIDDLCDSVARPVRWYDGVRLMAELGVTCTVEVTPGDTL